MKILPFITFFLLAPFGSYADTASKPYCPSGISTSFINCKTPPEFKQNAFMFGVGFVGQGYGIIVAMMDGSANADNSMRATTYGAITGLCVWTIIAVSTSVVIVPIIYAVIYGVPTYFLVDMYIREAHNNHNDNKGLEVYQEFKSSKDTVIVQDSLFLALSNKVQFNALPKYIRKHVDKSERDSVINTFQIKTSDNIFYAVETRQTFGYVIVNQEGLAPQRGHRIQFYNKKGQYLTTKWKD